MEVNQNPHMIMCFAGPPGSGKSTQAKEFDDWTWISAGEVLREEAKLITTRGKTIADLLSKGQLAPEKMTTKIMLGKIEKVHQKNNIILDGFPRTISQTEDFIKYCNKKGIDIKVIWLDAAEEEIKTRILRRSSIESRNDDNIDSLNQRMHIYREKSEPIFQLMKEKGIAIKRFNATGDIKKIHETIEDFLYETIVGKPKKSISKKKDIVSNTNLDIL